MPDQSCAQMPFTFTPPLRMVSSFWHTSVPPDAQRHAVVPVRQLRLASQ